MIVQCISCSDEFNCPPSKIKKGWGKFCKRSCYNKFNSVENNFMSKVIKENCWIWTGSIGKTGYGKLFVNGKFKSAHRYCWELNNGDIPLNLCVLHKCDNRNCVNPEHLFLGTHQDNMDDMIKKKRNFSLKGENHPRSKLKNTEVILIRKMIKQGIPNLDIAKKFNIDPCTISHIKQLRTWRESE